MNELRNREIWLGAGGKRTLLLLLSFFLPFILMLGALAGLQIAPFGDHTLLISDANGYYINTLAYAGRMFRGAESALYSFEKGLGGNMTGHLNGILVTPFAFLLGLFDITRYPSVYSFISVLNLSLGGLTMYLFLAERYGHKRSNLIFSTAYALMGFNVANVFQAVFFCAAPVLPVMALGLKGLLRGKSPLLYILSLAYGLLTNAYFGFVLCVASVLFFFTELALGGEAYEGKRLRLFVHYALASLCGGLLAAVLWLPGFLSLRGGRLEQTGLKDFAFTERQPLLEIGSKLFIGTNTTDEMVNGRPNLYVGLLPVALCILFFMNKNVEKRKKAAAGVLLGVYLLAFWILAFDMVMHAGTTTNWFNFRYSYVFSFLMLTVSAAQWERLEETPAKDIRRCFVGMAVAAVLIFYKRYDYVIAGFVLLDFALLALIGLALRMHRRNAEKNPRGVFELIALILVCIGLFLNYRVCAKNIRDWETTESEFQSAVSVIQPLVYGVQAADDGFYRMEVVPSRSSTGNDPMLFGYNGVGHGGSNERDFVRKELSKLGILWFSNRAFYYDGVPAATDSLFGLKYFVAKSDLAAEKGYEKRVELGDRTLYQNDDALPVAVLSADALDGLELDHADLFANLNAVWAALSGEDRTVFLEEDAIEFTPHSLSDPGPLTAEAAREITAYYDAKASASGADAESLPAPDALSRGELENGSYIEFRFTAARSGAVYAYNRGAFSEQSGSATQYLTFVGCFEAGEEVVGYLPVSKESVDRVVMEEYCGRFRAAYADAEALHELSELVRERPVTVEKEKETRLTGTFTADEARTLLFTIPWDEGWTCLVDGQAVPIRKALGALMAVDVPAGAHGWELRYEPSGLRLGAVIAACALLLTLVYLLFGRKWIDRGFDKRAAALTAKAEPESEEQTPEEGEENKDDPV